jgi:tripartite ATP-independent transporter DctM subunit
MERFGFSSKFAAGIVATVGTLGILIPPSVAMALYGLVSGESIGRLLIAGIIPGLMSGAVYIVSIIVLTRLFPSFALARKDATKKHSVDHREGVSLPSLVTGAILTGIIFLVVVGGIFTGIFTATESAAIGVVVAALILVVRFIHEPREIGQRLFMASKETTSTIGMLLALIVGGSIFTAFLVGARVPSSMTDLIIGLEVPPYVIVMLFLALMVVLGCILDGFSIILITVPLMHPIISQLGFNGVWFGVLVVKMIEVGLITPPVGLNVFVVSGVVPRIPVGDVFRGIMPFLVSELIIVSLIVGFPQIALFLPDMMR